MSTPHTGTPVVLLYHRIGRPKLLSLVAGQYVAPLLFRSELDYLSANGWSAIPLAQAAEGTSPEDNANRFAITFDDGYRSVYDHACPALMERNMTATIYVVSGAIGGINEWDSRAGDMREPMMSAAQIRELSEAGFEIGSHTVTHPHLTWVEPDQVKSELIDSKHALEDLIGKEVTSFSYPYGDCNEQVMDAAREAGYKNAVSTKLGVIGKNGQFDIPRVNVRWNAVGPLLAKKIRRARKATGPLD